MLERLNLTPLLRWLHRYDPEYQDLVSQAEQLNSRIAVAERQRAALETRIAQAEHELAKATAREAGLREHVSLLQKDVCSKTGPSYVLSDDFIASRVSLDRKHAWLVAVPKSGSTWLTNLLISLLGWQPNTLVPTWDRREQEVDVRRMLDFPDVDLFSIQQHCRFSAPTWAFVKKFRVQVILQGRNLWDCIVSLRDHFLRESTVTPVCYVDDSFRTLPSGEQLDSVIDLAVPWYLNFYASWFTGKQTGAVDFLWVDFESLLRDTPGQLLRIVAYLGISRSDEEVQKAMEKAVGSPTRLNVGRAGRGEETLTQSQKDRIARLRAHYRQIDFSPIGLD